MLEKFIKSLGFMGINANNMNYAQDEKNVFKFEDESIDKQWRCFLAFYRDGVRQGKIDTLNEISIDCIKKLESS